ncbi:Hypothetical predicted protein [Mytilus galloprovincialis]|uniref:Fibrinogen C-terminal domain-containing protein n=1 Tax=Mytilus galloprovincialis TaxID=29158 RepID=A0A8B6DF80_MYTGA|nr:Hypothetical predicted protein [Mytilus galloprovincialis]
MNVPLFLLLLYAFAINIILCDNEVRMRIQGSITATGTMENLTEDSNKAVKLATGIKDMLNGMCSYSDGKNSCEKMEKETQKVTAEMDSIKEKLDKILRIVTDMKNNGNGILPKECKDITDPGLQTIYLDDHRNMSVQCEEGGWTSGTHELRIDVEDWDGNKRYAVYRNFSIGDASTKYRLSINDYSGNAGDGMSYFNRMKFTTYDQDNDMTSINCADNPTFKGGWWYNNCWTYKEAMLNGHYTRNNNRQGIIYRTLEKNSLKKSSMKIRRL